MKINNNNKKNPPPNIRFPPRATQDTRRLWGTGQHTRLKCYTVEIQLNPETFIGSVAFQVTGSRAGSPRDSAGDLG